MINVLWIDDQYNDMIHFSLAAEDEGIILNGFSSFEEGFEALEQNIDHYDVILLDGLFFKQRGQVAGTEDEKGIGAAIGKINELKSRKVFPWLVFSGKDKFTKGENSLLEANSAECYDKTNPDDLDRLFVAIKQKAAQQPDLQLKHKYSVLLKVCDDDLLGSEKLSAIMGLIRDVESSDTISGTEDKLNQIRKLIERMFARMSENGLIPEQIIDKGGWINQSSRFLADKHTDYEHTTAFVPALVAENIKYLLKIVQDGSHGDGQLSLRVHDHFRLAPKDYLFRSSVYLLFDILIWFSGIMRERTNTDDNKACWKLKEGGWQKGTVYKVAPNGFGTFMPASGGQTISIPPRMVNEYKLSENDEIEVITGLNADKTKTHINEIRR